MTSTGALAVTATIDFHNADEFERPAILRFDARRLPSTVNLTVRLTAGVIPHATSGITARPVTSDDVTAPPEFGTDLYDIDGGTEADLAVNLAAFDAIRAFLSVSADKPQPAGARYTFDVLQYAPAQTNKGEELTLRGGSTFVVPIAGDPPASSAPPEDDDEEERLQPATYPWLRAIADQRFTQVFRHRRRGPWTNSVEVTNDRPDYVGPAPAAITFTATLTTDGPPGAICYAWLRNDGAIGQVANLAVPGPGIYTITTTWQLGQPGTHYEGWQALRVFGDDVQTSEKSAFSADFTTS